MPMIDDFAKEHLHDHLRWVREALVWKLDGLSEYDIRRPLTSTGTNLLGLVKHCAVWDSRYFSEVFGRPFPEPLPRWDDEAADDAQFWPPSPRPATRSSASTGACGSTRTRRSMPSPSTLPGTCPGGTKT